jgi:hypothetical protein
MGSEVVLVLKCYAWVCLAGGLSFCMQPPSDPSKTAGLVPLLKRPPCGCCSLVEVGLKGQNARLIHQNATSMHFGVKRHHWIFPGFKHSF